MKIEVGKFYKTRDGRKARIYTLDAGGTRPIQGAVNDDGIWRMEAWYTSGKYIFDGAALTDIVSEWTEPKPRMLAYLTNTGGVVFLAESEAQIPRNLTRAPWLDEPEEK